jgi:hypothetical protein
MDPEMHAFVAELAAHPTILAAIRADPSCAGRLENMESDLRELYKRGGGNADLIELFDTARRIVRSKHDMKERLRALLNFLIEFQARRVSELWKVGRQPSIFAGRNTAFSCAYSLQCEPVFAGPGSLARSLSSRPFGLRSLAQDLWGSRSRVAVTHQT